MMTKTDTPRVWIGCLGCYNSGRLVGEWFDATDCPTDMGDWFLGMWERTPRVPDMSQFLPDHRAEGHEELRVFDHENFHGALTGECSPAEAQRIATALVEAADNGTPMEAVGAYISNVGLSHVDWDTLPEDVQDAFMGEHDSGADYAQELAEGAGLTTGTTYGHADDKPRDLASEWPFTCIDWDRAWRELELGDGMWTHPTGNGTVYVFRSL